MKLPAARAYCRGMNRLAATIAARRRGGTSGRAPDITEDARDAGVPRRCCHEWPGRLIPSLAMRVSSVVGFRPSCSAAPPAPRIRHAVLVSTRQDVFLLDVDQLRAEFDGRRRRLRHRDAQAPAGRDDHGAFDDVAQLADVAGPGVLLQCREIVLVDRLDALAEARSRTPPRSARPAAGCPRRARAAAAPGSGRRSGGSRDPRGRPLPRSAAPGCDAWPR